MEISLRECPFCGGPAARIERPALSGRYVAACASNNCVMQHQIMAPETWNRRAPASARQGVGQRLPEPNPPLDQVATQGVGATPTPESDADRLIASLREHIDALGRANARIGAESAALRAELERVRGELANIANADPRTWDESTRDQFQEWAQNRARYALIDSAAALVITQTPTEEGGE